MKELSVWHREVVTGIKPWLIITHGIGEHSGRHSYLEDLFTEKYNLFFYDLRGHGNSEGVRGDVESFKDYSSDLLSIIEHLMAKHNMIDYSLFGHSMGALITLDFVQNYMAGFTPTKVFLSAPPSGVSGALGKVVDLVPQSIFELLNNLTGKIKIPGLLDINFLSHDKKIIDDYRADKLNILDLNFHLFVEVVITMKKVFSRKLDEKLDICCVIGSEDPLATLKNLMSYYQETAPQLKLTVIEGSYHEMHNEVPEYRDQFLTILTDFLAR